MISSRPNILLDDADGTARLCDFGIARLADTTHHTLTVTGIAIGTPAYMSPEQARGDTTLGAPSDLYSLGCLLHELLVGSVPFVGTGWQVLNQHLNTAPTPLSALRPGVPRELEQLVLELLDKDPDRRPSAADTRTRLLAGLAAIADAPTAVPTEQLPTPTLVVAVPGTAAHDCPATRTGRTALTAGAVTAAAIAGELSLTTALPATWSVALGSAAGLLLAGAYFLDPPRPHAAQELRMTTAGLLTMLILTGGAALAVLIAAPSSHWKAALALAFMGGPTLVGGAMGVRRLIEGALRRGTGWSADLATTAGVLPTTTLVLAAHRAGFSALALALISVALWPAAALMTAVVIPRRAGHADAAEERTDQTGRAPSGRPQSAVAA
ncbi:serine/threonine-protein kinase [Streptomyces galbus]|uniref:serine/threonine-protein kinase n=1 Tax=Streptomyces galbus TaxID=33898 RepID=UPI0038137F31